jgi:hypothetical protein
MLFQNSVRRRIFGPKLDEVSVGLWKELHNEELHSLWTLPNTIRMIRSRNMRSTKHVAHEGDGK